MPATTLKGAHLSLQQDRLWFFQQGSRTYRSQCTVFMKGTLNRRVFQQALQQLVEQHTIFQTVFYFPAGMDVPIQVMGHRIAFSFPMINLEEIAGSRQPIVLHALVTSLQEQAFDLKHGPLFCPVMFHLSAETTLLLISLPALCADALTLPLLLADLAKRYTACLSGQELSEEPLQYTAVSAWQKQVLLEESEGAKTAHEFWKKWDVSRVAQVQQLLEQAGLVKHGSLQAMHKTIFEPLTLPLGVEEAVSRRIHALASDYHVSVTAVLLACWFIVLWRLTDESPFVIGVACDGRNYEELAEALGLYTRFVPLSAYLEDDWTFEQVVTFIEPLLEVARKYQSSFSWSGVSNATPASPNPSFFPVTFEHEKWPASFPAEELILSLDQRWCCTEPFMLKLSILQVGERLQLELHYDPQSVITGRVTRLASMLQVLLQSVVEQPQAPVGALTLLTADEQSHLLTTFRAPVRSLPTWGWHRLFEAHVKRLPSQLAVISAGEQLTYQQVNERANRLARVLRRRGVGPNVLVGLCMTRSAHMLVGLLGILKAGGAYVPLDPESPSARLSYQVQESQFRLLLAQQEVGTHLPEWGERTLWLEDLEQEMSEAPASDLAGGSEMGDLAYIIYTSGSTGMPKGVMIQQGSVVNYALALCDVLRTEPGWQYATVSTLAADLGNTAIFCALASGGCVQVLDYETVTSAEAMARWMEQHPIDVLKIVPSHLSALLAGEHSKEVLPRRALVLGGEILPLSLLEHLRQLGGTCEVYNHYGPTEATIGVLVNPLSRMGGVKEETGATIPLGRPITNTQVYVLNQRMQVVPVGVTGELYIGGAGLAMGYVQQPEQTAERFVPHPWSQQAGARLYRTGDLARYSEEGKIEFVGRCDNQVKLRGYRIELAEVETTLRQHPNIRDSAVVVREDPSTGLHLVGYIVPRKLPLPAGMNIDVFLRERLPEYMVPSAFVYLKFLPLSANGKVDRQQLVAKRGENHSLSSLVDVGSQSRMIVQPRDAIEWRLLQIWEDVLQMQPLSVIDNFFDLGGHSLLAVRLMSHIAKHFGQNLNLATLFEHPTVAELAAILRQQIPPEDRSPLVAIQPQGTRPPFFCVPPGGGTAFCYVNLARRLGPDQPFYGLHTPDWRNIEDAWATVEEMALHYLAALQTVQPQGPYLLGGWSSGGVIAFEMAQQLQRQGEEVGLLAILDSWMSDAQVRAETMEEEVDLGDTGVIKWLIRHFKIAVPDDFDRRELDEQLSYATDQAKKMHAIPIDTSLELVRRYTRIGLLNKHIVHLYDPQSYPYQIDYFASSHSMELTGSLGEREDAAENPVRRDHMELWRELAQGGLQVHLVSGDHQTMVEEPHVQVLAKELQLCIDRVCNQLLYKIKSIQEPTS